MILFWLYNYFGKNKQGASLILFMKCRKDYQHRALTLFFSKNMIFLGRTGRFWHKLKGKNIFWFSAFLKVFCIKNLILKFWSQFFFKKAPQKIFPPFWLEPNSSSQKGHIYTEKQSRGTVLIIFLLFVKRIRLAPCIIRYFLKRDFLVQYAYDFMTPWQ